MRRIEIIFIGLAIFAFGGVSYLLLQYLGIDGLTAGIWTQLLLILGVVGWILSYLWRVLNHNMTYNQQLKDYEEAVLRKRLEEMTPEELAQLEAEIAEEKNNP
ncbi:DUF3007 family protein [Gloeocapsa sp. PCC 73106]|uniref:DUF3007 family protein n=1 Tax=Gloeocapsa sp. PCC 73106 TaxID=102232 RepID=UPI0002AC9881|nr:DUF3007 family protein [Gloeocapsa sp. PCC 73106]ELR96989.1 Protein of unknown function (DUF3007) [Gloeocapsa sp. PCC 73106]